MQRKREIQRVSEGEREEAWGKAGHELAKLHRILLEHRKPFKFLGNAGNVGIIRHKHIKHPVSETDERITALFTADTRIINVLYSHCSTITQQVPS